MIFPVHHLPGRLRIKSTLIKGDSSAAGALRGRLLAIAGIEKVEVSAATGCAVIQYSRDAITGLGILKELNQLGYAVAQGEGFEAPCQPPADPPGPGPEKVMESLFQALVERSARALAAAVI